MELLPYDLDSHFSLGFALQMIGHTKQAELHRKKHADLVALSREVPDAVNAYKDVTDLPNPKAEDLKKAMLRLAAACAGMGWKKDAEGWVKSADEL